MQKNGFYSVNIHEISDKELRNFIAQLQQKRIDMNDVPGVSANEVAALLNIAASELSSRSGSKLAKISIVIAVISLILASLSIIIQ